MSAIADLTVSPYNSEGVSRIQVRGPDILVSRDAGTTIALCLQELITNAIKYGALSFPEGYVDIVWMVAKASDPVLSLN